MNTTQTQKERTRQALRIFLSYTIVDKEYAHKLHKILSPNRGLHIFTVDMLSAGEDWLSRLKEEIAQCDLFMVILSPNSIKSEWVLSELGAAWALDKHIVPITTSLNIIPEIPIQLRDTQSIDIKFIEEHPEVIYQIIEDYEQCEI